jgi:hypothetical protein
VHKANDQSESVQCPGESVGARSKKDFFGGNRIFSFVDFCIFCHCIMLRDLVFQPRYRSSSFSFLGSCITGKLVDPLISVNPSMPWDPFNFRAPSLPMTELYSFYNSDRLGLGQGLVLAGGMIIVSEYLS